MNQKIMAICDIEEGYAFRMAEYMLEKVRLPYTLHLFTAASELEKFARREEIAVLLIAESALKLLKEESIRQQVLQMFVLQESEHKEWEDLCYISKYQSPERVVQLMLEYVTDLADWKMEDVERETAVKMIGIYSPVKRCLQTSFALSLGQILSKEHKVLYLNLETYSGLARLLKREFTADIMDAMYCFQSAREKLVLRMPSIIQNIGGLDYIPPSQHSFGFQEVTGEQWLDFCRDVAMIGQYEFIILDVGEGVNDLFQLLGNCCKIYTVTRDDEFAKAKLDQYEQSLKFNGLEEIAEKTVQCRFPIFRELPENLEMMTRGELAAYVRSIIKEDIYE